MNPKYKVGQIVKIKKRFCKRKGHRKEMYGCDCTEKITIQSVHKTKSLLTESYLYQYNKLYWVCEEYIIGGE